MDHSSSQEKHLRSGDLLTDVVIGMSDGLIVPFAVVAGFSGAASQPSVIVVAGLITIAGGAITLGLGGYLAGKEEAAHFQQDLPNENNGVNTVHGKKEEEVKGFFANIGLSEEMQERAVEEMVNDKKEWNEFLAKYDLKPLTPDPNRAIKSAFNIGLSYVTGGLIPLVPFFFNDIPLDALRISAVITLLCLFIFGFFRSRIMGLNPWIGALRAMVTGGLAAAAAFGVARLFGA